MITASSTKDKETQAKLPAQSKLDYAAAALFSEAKSDLPYLFVPTEYFDVTMFIISFPIGIVSQNR